MKHLCRIPVTSAFCVLVTMLGACSSQSNAGYRRSGFISALDNYSPYPSYPQYVCAPMEKCEPADKSARPVDYAAGLQYAYDVEASYREYLERRARTGAGYGSLLIMIAGSAAGLGAAGVSGNPIIALTGAGATGAALGTWYQTSEKTAAFRTGLKAVECVIAASAPADITADEASNIRLQRQRLEDANFRLDQAIAEILDSGSDVDVRPVQRVIDQARENIVKAYELDAFGRQIAFTVHAIDEDVFGSANANEPTLTQLQDIIKKMPAPKATLSPAKDVPSTQAKKAEKKAVDSVKQLKSREAVKMVGEDLTQHFVAPSTEEKQAPETHEQETPPAPLTKPDDVAYQLQNTVIEVADLNNALTRSLNHISVPDQQFHQCVDPERAALAESTIIVQPALILPKPPADGTEITISGGRPDYNLAPLENDLELSDRVKSADAVTVTVKLKAGAATSHDHHLLISDSAEHAQTVTFGN